MERVRWSRLLTALVFVVMICAPVAALSVGMTPEADTASGGNAVYVFALPQ